MTSNSRQVVVRRFATAIFLLFIGALLGCGNGSNSAQGPGLGPGPNNSLLHGQYAFSFSGQNRNNGAVILGIGSFTADGNGGITGGMQDVNVGAGGRSFTFTGKYSVDSDLRGTAILNGLQICPNWQFVLLNSSHALMTCFDTVNTASGSIDIQNTTAFTNARLTGDYVFGISGVGTGNTVAPIATIAGDWTMDGNGTITGGEMDINDSLSTIQDLAFTGTYNVASTGRGTLTVNSTAYGTQNFVFYVVNSGDLKLLETDVPSASFPQTSGEVLQEASAPFTLASLNGGYVFTLGGADRNGFATGTGGLFVADGSGNISSGVLDDNDGGSTSLGSPIAGTYSVGTFGRALVTFSFLQLAAYPAANGTLMLVELDGNGVSAGMAKIQTGGPFSAASVSGGYGLNWAGTLEPSISPSEEDITGQLTADGVGNLSGKLDINSISGIGQGLQVGASTYTATSSGYSTASINTAGATFNMHTYQADPNTVLFLDIDTSRVMTGIMQKQQ